MRWLMLIVLFVAAVPAARAQNSCDDPPFDTSSISRVWDLTDFCQYQDGVFEEIISGGVGRDGIPPIDEPTFDDIDAASEWLADQSPVVAVEIDGAARAYPLAIMTRHEIVNDTFDEIPVAVTFCPLCNSALVFDRRVDGDTLRFGVSGLLRNSDLIMWDDKTQSWWQQFTGEGIVGEYTGTLLDIYPSLIVSFAEFRQQFPDGEVLARPNNRAYGSNPYVGYDSSATPFLFTGELDDRLPATERVLAYVAGEDAVAYPFSHLSENPVINDTVGETDVVALWQPGTTSALDRADIDASRDTGMAALYDRTLDGERLSFTLEDGVIRDEQTGSTWNIFGEAIDGELSGARLTQLRAFPHFWFSWAAFHPDTAIYGDEG